MKPMLFAAALAIAAGPVSTAVGQTQTVLASGLKNPSRLIVTDSGNILVSEAGDAAPNTGRLSRVSATGTRTTVIDNLPSGVAPDNVTGPWHLGLRGSKTLFVAIGTGDTTVLDGGGNGVPNPAGPSSPLFSSVLGINFSKTLDKTSGGFVLTAAAQQTLANGYAAVLNNTAGETAEVFVLTDVRDIVRDASGAPRRSNPFGLAVGSNALWISDASRNDVQEVDLCTGRARQVAPLAPIPNPLPFGPPALEPVPTGLAEYGNSLLVALETGFPFPAGAAEIKRVNPDTGAVTTFIGGLTQAIDILVSPNHGQSKFYVIELSTDLLSGAPGRLLRFDSPTATPTVLSSSLIFPSSVGRDTHSGALYVTQFFTGEIVKIVP